VDVKAVVETLLAKLPTDTSQLMHRLEQIQTAVPLTGALLGRRGDRIVVRVGSRDLELQESDILSIRESESSPAIDYAGVFVELTVKAGAQIVESRKTSASELGQHPGKRPFVYAQPSHAREFMISGPEYRERELAWAKHVRLEDFPGIIRLLGPTTFTTPVDTSWDTNFPTCRTSELPGGGTSTDCNTDHTPDHQTDNNSDSSDDG
jgi:hypothetical protein